MNKTKIKSTKEKHPKRKEVTIKLGKVV